MASNLGRYPCLHFQSHKLRKDWCGDFETLGCTASIGNLGFQGGPPAIYCNAGRAQAVLVFANIYGPSIPGAARPVIIICFGERDVLAKSIGWDCLSQARKDWQMRQQAERLAALR